MKTSILAAFLLALLTVPTMAQSRKDLTPVGRTMAAGWFCTDAIPGEWHCFPPTMSSQTLALAVKVYLDNPGGASDGSFLGTEHLWSSAVYAGQGCPQDVILVEPIPGFMACHHYADSEISAD